MTTSMATEDTHTYTLKEHLEVLTRLMKVITHSISDGHWSELEFRTQSFIEDEAKDMEPEFRAAFMKYMAVPDGDVEKVNKEWLQWAIFGNTRDVADELVEEYTEPGGAILYAYDWVENELPDWTDSAIRMLTEKQS